MPPTSDHPLERPRLIAPLLEWRVGLIEAGGGYGKSVLVAQVRDALAIPALEVALGPGDGSAAGLVARLRSAAAGSNRSDLVGALGGRTLHGVAPLLATWPDPVLLVIDDAHLLDAEAAATLAELIAALPAPHRGLVAARLLPAPIARLRGTSDVASLDADELRLDAAETADLLRVRFGLQADPATVERVVRVTDGWAAAVTLIGTRVARSQEPDALALLLDRGPTFASLLADAIARLGPEAARALGQLARLAVIPAAACPAMGVPDLAAQAAAAGIPVTPLAGGAWALPGPVADSLAATIPLDPRLAARLCRLLVDEGDGLEGLRLAVDAGAPGVAATTLAGLSPERVLLLDITGLQALVDALPADTVAAEPAVLLQLARACEPPGRMQARVPTLARAAELAERADDRATLRAVRAEQARDLVRDGAHEAAAAIAAAILDETGSDETLVRARALDVQGRCLAARRDGPSLRQAGEVLRSAMTILIAQRQRQWASQVAMPLAVEAQHGIGRSEDALRTLDEAMRPLPARSLQRALILTFRAQVLDDVGRPDAADADIAEALRVGEVLGDRRVVAYATWELARAEMLRGRRAPAIAALHAVEAHAGDWFDQATGATFLAVAAEVASRVGEPTLALEYLERAVARRDESAAPVDLAVAAVHARVGDPALALAALDRLAVSDRRWPRDAWRCDLFRAHAQLRSDEDPTTAARAAFAGAQHLGLPDLPMLREADIAGPLQAIANGMPAWLVHGPAGDRPAPETGTLIVLALGDLELRRDGRPVEPPVGRACDVLGILVAGGGRADADAVADQLWPEEEDADLRTRLRNVLSRARDALGPVIERRGAQVVLVGVDVDAWTFEAEARSIAARPPGDPDRARVARSAIGRYRGDLFADHRDAAWAVAPRERLRRMTRSCLTVLVEEAELRGDVDEALRLLDRVLDLDVDDESTYVRAARLLASQGREGAARGMLERGRQVLDELGVPVPPDFRDLEAGLRWTGTAVGSRPPEGGLMGDAPEPRSPAPT